ncbi:hypothetical protein EDEG_00987 [Edhazardia aedis USNM 41457]|uniref:N-acetyltransferase domain-containing protein n=1 Tax=Edhazardia aedis (strain USNM 41457) TaxID=1003232 RepID=J9DU43_EDHAE|nr:hypothetical protein EDEG_00987 [Edhazardia aedis USNM 41457]|eukprot:EJW04817.1 hypothetical protein EDEG_00987 [Edhazardia aedis USNM 41457]
MIKRILILTHIFLQKTQDVRFIYMPGTTQPIKSIDQLKDIKGMVYKEFRNGNDEQAIYKNINTFTICQYRTPTELVTNMFIVPKKFYGLFSSKDLEKIKRRNNSFLDKEDFIANSSEDLEDELSEKEKEELKKSFLIEKNVLSIYTVFTNPLFRGKGYAKKLLEESIREYLKTLRKKTQENNLKIKVKNNLISQFLDRFKLNLSIFNYLKGKNYEVDNLKKKLPSALKNTILDTELLLTLHLNPKDTMMNFNYAFYYSLGFRRASFCEYGPPTFEYSMEKFLTFRNARKEIKRSAVSREIGGLFCMACRVEDFLNPKNRRALDREMIEEGEKLRKILLARESSE